MKELIKPATKLLVKHAEYIQCEVNEKGEKTERV